MFVPCLRLLTENNGISIYLLPVSMAINSQDVKASRFRRSIKTMAAGLLLFVSFMRQKVMMVDDIVGM